MRTLLPHEEVSVRSPGGVVVGATDCVAVIGHGGRAVVLEGQDLVDGASGEDQVCRSEFLGRLRREKRRYRADGGYGCDGKQSTWFHGVASYVDEKKLFREKGLSIVILITKNAYLRANLLNKADGIE